MKALLTLGTLITLFGLTVATIYLTLMAWYWVVRIFKRDNAIRDLWLLFGIAIIVLIAYIRLGYTLFQLFNL